MTHVLLLQADQPSPQEMAALIALMVTILLVAILVQLAISALICALLYACFKRVPVEHRTMSPGLVWLLLIPLFNLVWNFFVFPGLADTYKRYFTSVGREDVGDAGRTVGLWLAICGACSLVPCLNYVSGPAYLVLLIIFLVKAWGYRAEIPVSASA